MVDSDVAVVGAGVVGTATALALARRGVSITLLEAEPAPALAASGTNSGIVHTGFDSPPGELETDLILRSAELRDPVMEALGLRLIRCGAVVRPTDPSQLPKVEALQENARRNGVETTLGEDGSLLVPGEGVTDPIAYTRALATAARGHGAELITGTRVVEINGDRGDMRLQADDDKAIRCSVVVNCAGLYADEVARMAGDKSFEIYPRKGEFLVFEPPGGKPLQQILLPVPSERTKGVLVFPTVDGKVVAGPTAVDGGDKGDWSVRPQAQDEILPKAMEMLPTLEGSEPVTAYAGLRPAGRSVNYLIAASDACPGLINAAAIRSTGLTASLGIAERVTGIAAELGIALGPEQALQPVRIPSSDRPWWRQVADHRTAA